MRKIFFTFVLLIHYTVFLFAQDSPVGFWYRFAKNFDLGKDVTLVSDVQYRNYNIVGDTEQILLRTGFAYDIAPKISARLGYAFILDYDYTASGDRLDKTQSIENRLFQEITLKHKFSRVDLRHRYRFEQQWFSDTDDVQLRARYAVLSRTPINSSTFQKKTTYVFLMSELFFTNNQDVFNRVRLEAGVGYFINDLLRIRVTYMNQLRVNRNRGQIVTSISTNF